MQIVGRMCRTEIVVCYGCNVFNLPARNYVTMSWLVYVVGDTCREQCYDASTGFYVCKDW